MKHKNFTKDASLRLRSTSLDQMAEVRGHQFQDLIDDFDAINPSDGELVGHLTGNVTGEITVLGAVETAEHGAGAIGTAFAPKTYRYNAPNGDIITEIQIDLTGLESSGSANDVIGLTGGSPAYIGRNVVATNGIIYKVEMTCLEVPTGGDADVILVQGSTGTEAVDDTVANTAAICDGTGDWLLGETMTYTSGLTANYYLYLTQGGSDNAVYTAGQFLIRLYGHAALS